MLFFFAYFRNTSISHQTWHGVAWNGIVWTKNWLQTAVNIVYASILNDSINVTHICCAEKNVYAITYMNVSCIFQESYFPFAFACQKATNILPNFFRVNAIQWIILSSSTFVRPSKLLSSTLFSASTFHHIILRMKNDSIHSEC